MSKLVSREDRKGMAILTLNRPDKLNALSKDMFAALDEQLDKVGRQSRTVGLVVLRGAGGHFSAGYDMAEVREYVRARAKPHYHSEVIDRLASLPQPTLCVVEGQCSTGALELALAADLIAATEDAQFSDVYARWGLTPVWGLSLRLPHRVGTAKASEMMFTCRQYSGREAHDMHLVNFCFPVASLEQELETLCQDILANSWYANQVTKRALIESDSLTLHDAYSLDLFKNEGLAPDVQQRVEAFFSRTRK